MTNIAMFCDGTWNNPSQEDNGIPSPTNVFKLYNSLAEQDDNHKSQLKYYHPGLGGEEIGIKEKILGGALGLGITRHICSAYHWLANNYNQGDQIYIFGFSRGAFTARALSGMLNIGLLNLKGISSKQSWSRVKKAYDQGYKHGKTDWRKTDWTMHSSGDPIKVKFLGVWDTVGALGIPDDLEILNLLDRPSKWQFHDRELGENVLHGRHAMALDEFRSSFTVTRWSNTQKHNDAIELWFPGVHSDVGGGYSDTDLSNIALKWMMKEAEKFGLKIREEVKDRVKHDHSGVMHNSYKGVFAKLRSRPRNIPAVTQENQKSFHESVFQRQKISPIEYPQYHPTIKLEEGESKTISIYADTRWNHTGIYLSEGEEYTFAASGEWQDSKDSCTWEGTEDGKLTTGDIIRGTGTFLGNLENLFKKLTRNESTDFLGSKRVENIKWFRMVGVIANDSGEESQVKNDGSPTAHEYISLPEHQEHPLRIKAPGYLYAFPNDVWALYDNNHGFVALTITRVT